MARGMDEEQKYMQFSTENDYDGDGRTRTVSSSVTSCMLQPTCLFALWCLQRVNG
jgi:hypothetical protein